jgi:hypothetical protein
MSEMIEVTCPVCGAHVAHEGRFIRGSATEFAKCTYGNVRDCIELWRAWKRAEDTVYRAATGAAQPHITALTRVARN